MWIFLRTLALLAVAATLARAAPKLVLVMHTPGALPEAVARFERTYGRQACQIVVAGEVNAVQEIAGASIIFLEHPGPEFLDRTRAAFAPVLKGGARLLTDVPEVVLRQWNQAPDPALNNRALAYFRQGGAGNYFGFLQVLYRAAHGPLAMETAPPEVRPERGVYHPRAPRVFANLREYLAWYRRQSPGRGRLVIVSFYQSFLRDQETEVIDSLIAALERQGLAAAGVFGWPYSGLGAVLETPEADPVTVNLSFTLSLSRPEDAVTLEKQGAHVISLMQGNFSYEEWARGDRGVTPDRVATSLVSPERNGATEPILVSTQEPDPRTGIYHIKPIAERVEMAARRARRWVTLRDKPNAEKRVAILYYNNPPGKGNLGASYLNLPPSIVAVLRQLHDAGYNTGDRLPTSDELLAQLEHAGRNIELWAPGELDAMVQAGGVTLLPVERYRTWFDTLPRQFRDAVNARWGRPEAARLMTLTARDGRKFYVIPGIRLGNVFLGPQLLRASSEEYTNVQHSATLPPHHAYVASYLYYRHQFQADAVLHMGRHGTLEWLPGKNAGQAGWDSSEVILGDLPNLNYYIMDGGGEALQARRRGAAVDISHLTPMLARGGAQQRFAALQKAVNEWSSTHDTSPALAEQYRQAALAEARRLHLDTQLGLPAEGDEALHRLAGFLETAEEAPIPLSLPVLGQPQKEEYQREGLYKLLATALTPGDLKVVSAPLRAWSDAIFDGRPPQLPDSLPATLRTRLGKAFDEAHTWLASLRQSPPRELAALIDVLNGRFLPSGLVGDPLAVPAALPSGRNLHDTDPALFPTRAAWEVGKRMADQLMERYRQEHHNAWPEQISMVLWSGETGRHQGAMEAEALYLMGVAPEWNARGVVDRVTLIPDAQLGRPRVNVLFTVSGMYRDGLAGKMLLLDRAARIAAAAGDNALSRRNRKVEQELVTRGVPAAEARHLAGARVFSEAPGAYGNGVSNMVETDGSKDQSQATAELYLAKTNYVYTDGVWGGSTPRLLASQLRGNQVILHSRSSNLYGIADNDDVYQYVGGLDLASKSVGAAPDLMFNNFRTRGRERLEGAREVLAEELNSRNWNPKWLKGMKEAGYSGAREMANSVDFLYGWQATSSQVVDASVWKKTYDVYVADEHHLGLPEFLAQANPYAQQKLVGRLLEVGRQGIYHFSASEKARLVQAYVQSIAKLGVACSAVVCGNRKLREYVMEQGRGVASAADMQQFAERFRKATTATASSAAPAMAPLRPVRARKPDPAALNRMAILTLHPAVLRFVERPFGIEWSLWLVFSFAFGGLIALYRRRVRLWSTPGLFPRE